MKPYHRLVFGSLVFVALAHSAQAAIFYWDGGTGNWDTVANWSSDLAGTTDPGARPLATVGDIVNFNTTLGNAASSTLYLNGTRGTSGVLATMNFNTSGATTLLGGTSATAGNNDLFISKFTVNSGSGAVTIGDVTLSPSARFNLKAGSISFTNNSSSLLSLANGPAAADTMDRLFLGTPPVQVPAGVYDSSHPTFGSYFTGSGSLSVQSGPGSSAFDAWATVPYGSSGADAAFDFDYDNDGLDNGLEWILGGNPTRRSTPKAPMVGRNLTGDLVLTFTRKEGSVSESMLKVLIGTTLAAWPKEVTVGSSSSRPDLDDVIVSIDTAATADLVTITIPASNGAAGKLFARLSPSSN